MEDERVVIAERPGMSEQGLVRLEALGALAMRFEEAVLSGVAVPPIVVKGTQDTNNQRATTNSGNQKSVR
jgi:hypothetical protein